MARAQILGLFLVVSLQLLTLDVALAARGARVNVGPADFRGGPGAAYPVIAQIPRGTPLAAANQATQGYFKVRLPDGRIGWILETALVLGPVAVPQAVAQSAAQPAPNAVPVAPVAPENNSKKMTDKDWLKLRKTVTIRAFGGMSFFQSVDINSKLNGMVLFNSVHLGGEVLWHLKPSFSLALKVQMITESVTVDNSTGTPALVYDFVYTGMPILLGASFNLAHGPRADLELGTFAGATLSSLKITPRTAGDVADTMKATAFSALVRLDFSVRLLKWLSVYAEGGYLYAKSPATPSATLLLNGSYPLDFSGLYGSGGLGITF